MKFLTLTASLILLLATSTKGQERKNLFGAGIEFQSVDVRPDSVGKIAGGMVLSYSRALYQEKAFGFYLDLRPKLLFDQSTHVALGGSVTLELRLLGMSDSYPIGLKYGWGYHFMNYSAGDQPGFNLDGINYNKFGVLFPSTDLVNELAVIVYRYQGQFMFGISVISVDLFNKSPK